MELTNEQQQIISCNDNLIVINAFAGSGKTSTLVEFARQRPDKSFLYIAYNKAMAEEAKTKFTSNVKCSTLHALAYAVYGRRFSRKLGNDRVMVLADKFRANYDDVKHATGLLNRYFNSDKATIVELILHPDNGQKRVITLAIEIWKSMRNIESATKIPHDGYLKLFQLSTPVFSHDYTLLDEAQDSNDVTMSIIVKSTCANKIIIGDTHQSIYGFRGAKDALADFKKIPGCTNLSLTQSFRFNDDIAGYASDFLTRNKGYVCKFTGSDKDTQFITGYDRELVDTGAVVISRNNATLFNFALSRLTKNQTVVFSGGIERYDIDLFRALCDLDSPKLPKELKRFADIEQIAEYAEVAGEHDLMLLSGLVIKYGSDQTERFIDTLIQQQELKSHDYILVTGHRSKGLEFNSVFVCSDFKDRIDWYKNAKLNTPWLYSEDAFMQEINLYYVAITRAKQILLLESLPETAGAMFVPDAPLPEDENDTPP